MNDTAVCSVTDAAEMLGIATITAQRWARRGALPVVGKLAGKTGAYVLDRAAVERLAVERSAPAS